MADRDDILKSDSKPSGVGLGERLQAARIQQGLSVDDIATRMHLNAQIVKSIEDNNFDDITAPIFVKGYLRAYARIVSLDEEELIEQYSKYYSHEDPPISTTSNMAPELSVADVRIKWATYLVILGLAALLAAWWWTKNQEEATPISLGSQPQSETILQSDTDAGGEPAVERTGESGAGVSVVVESPAPAESAGSEAARQEPASEQPAASQSGTTQADLSAAPGSVASETDATQPVAPPPAPVTENPEEPTGETQPASAAVAQEEPQQEAVPATPEPAEESAPAPVRMGAPVLVAPTGSDTLTLTVNADTWADIKDGNDFQMVYHLLRAGQSLQLTGSAPFSVFLGNGPGVEIRFNGEPFEFSARVRSDNTARLKIGG